MTTHRCLNNTYLALISHSKTYTDEKHKLLSISAVIMMLSAYGCSLDEFNPSGISTEQEWSTPAGYERK